MFLTLIPCGDVQPEYRIQLNKNIHSDSFLQKYSVLHAYFTGQYCILIYNIYNFAHEKEGDLTRRRCECWKREKKA